VLCVFPSHLLDTSLDDDEGECTGKRFMEAMVADTYDTAYGTAYDTARLAEKAKVLWQTLLRVGKYESRGFTCAPPTSSSPLGQSFLREAADQVLCVGRWCHYGPRQTWTLHTCVSERLSGVSRHCWSTAN